MLNQIKNFFENGNKLTLVIIIASFIGLFLLLLIIILFLSLKKKKYRKQLNLIRNKILSLKEHEVIKNYASYDNLKGDEKLGTLILRWKKEIEKFIREVDAQYSMLDVLEDAISQGNYHYFINLITNIEKDIQELEEKANEYKNEIIEYVDIASDNRKYISKYQEMLSELKQEYYSKINIFKDNKENIEKFFYDLDKKFSECNLQINNSNFIEADKTASEIFKDIKIIEHYIYKAPKIISRINEKIIPKLYQLNNLVKKFTKEELKILNIDHEVQFKKYTNETKKILNEVNSFIFSDFENRLVEIENYLNNTIMKLEQENKSKQYIIDNIKSQKNYLFKMENTAQNFITIFKTVIGSYNITSKEIAEIENLLKQIVIIKEKLDDLEIQLSIKGQSFNDMIDEVENIKNNIENISEDLDKNLIIIDEIYKDEKSAREQINLMTEKINGTKKYIKYANLENQDKYLTILKQLNKDLIQLYVLLGSFPIDIIKLNNAIKVIGNRVEKTTQEINRIIYKTLLAEFVLLYANRYFNNIEYQKELLLAEELFYKKSYNKAYEKAMEVLEKIDVNNKKIVLQKYQTKFNEIFG